MRRLETGSLVAGLGAALLVVSLFLDWYEPDLTAWNAFEVWDLVLAALGLAVLAAAAAELGWWRGPLPGVEVLLAGSCALVIVVAVLINHPPAAIGRGVKDGAWLGLGGAVLMVAGGLMARVGVSLSLSLESQSPGRASGRSRGGGRAARPAAGARGSGRLGGAGGPPHAPPAPPVAPSPAPGGREAAEASPPPSVRRVAGPAKVADAAQEADRPAAPAPKPHWRARPRPVATGDQETGITRTQAGEEGPGQGEKRTEPGDADLGPPPKHSG